MLPFSTRAQTPQRRSRAALKSKVLVLFAIAAFVAYTGCTVLSRTEILSPVSPKLPHDRRGARADEVPTWDAPGSSEAGPAQEQRQEAQPPPWGGPVPDLGASTPEQRAQAVKHAMVYAWQRYREHAWGADEIRPVTGERYEWLHQGATIVDSLDTLWIMRMDEEFKEARDWVAHNLTFDANCSVSVFETVIRVVGGLLSAYDLSGDRVFLTRAEECAHALLPAYETESGIPLAWINYRTRAASGPKGSRSVLAEAGSVLLEFEYLSRATGNSVFAHKAMKVVDVVSRAQLEYAGLYPTMIDWRSGRFRSKKLTVGGLVDSYYEYLLKLWVLRGGPAADADAQRFREMYDQSARAIERHLVGRGDGGLVFVSEINYARSRNLTNRMDHLACFAGGMFALGARAFGGGRPGDARHMELAEGVARTCHEMYATTPTGLAPEVAKFVPGAGVRAEARHYLLRPEAVETMLYMWRYSHEQRYRDWAWEVFVAIERHCRAPYGYSGVKNVEEVPATWDNGAPSYFHAETLKYLYLMFMPDDVIPLDQYVFNTEAHPFTIFADGH
eukprot:m51a1_g6200 putative mannosyl-oligosaccharide -alpha-mannosidase ia (559) ;mRNA; f:115244-117459